MIEDQSHWKITLSSWTWTFLIIELQLFYSYNINIFHVILLYIVFINNLKLLYSDVANHTV